MTGIKQNGILGHLLLDSWLSFAEHLIQDCFMRIDMTDEERDVLIARKKYQDTYKPAEIKAEAILDDHVVGRRERRNQRIGTL